MGLPNALPFYNQNGSNGNLVKGLNFGSAQATIMNTGSQGNQSLNQQLRQVFEMAQLLQLQLSQRKFLHFIRSSVFYLSFGKDNYINFFPSNGTPKHSTQEIAPTLANEMVHAVRNLHELKVRKIICQGILPLGCTPRTMRKKSDLAAVNFNGAGSWEKINEMVLEYNVMLEEKIMELNAEMRDAHIVFCDVYQGIREIIAKPKSYGFENVKRACCGLGLFGATVGCLTAEMACKMHGGTNTTPREQSTSCWLILLGLLILFLVSAAQRPFRNWSIPTLLVLPWCCINYITSAFPFCCRFP